MKSFKEINEVIEVPGIKKAQERVGNAIIDGITLTAQLHAWHLTAPRRSTHEVLGSFYQELQEKVDVLAETFKAVGGDISNLIDEYDIDFSFEWEDIQDEIEGYRYDVGQAISLTKSTDLQSVNTALIDIQGLIDRNLYRLDLV